MIKPILYHSIEDKEALERELMASIPAEKTCVRRESLDEHLFTPEKRSVNPRKPRKRR
jgi:hypothetical protein